MFLQRFQSTHPHGVRPEKAEDIKTKYKFQSTHPHGVRHALKVISVDREKFQSTHPHGVRPAPNCEAGTTPRCQSTHPHGVRLFALSNIKIYMYVSIHAPTRGATKCHVGETTNMVSFNPRTHTGCDRARSDSSAYLASFNPRTHTGCDLSWSDAAGMFQVSIHAPTRGAT